MPVTMRGLILLFMAQAFVALALTLNASAAVHPNATDFKHHVCGMTGEERPAAAENKPDHAHHTPEKRPAGPSHVFHGRDNRHAKICRIVGSMRICLMGASGHGAGSGCCLKACASPSSEGKAGGVPAADFLLAEEGPKPFAEHGKPRIIPASDVSRENSDTPDPRPPRL